MWGMWGRAVHWRSGPCGLCRGGGGVRWGESDRMPEVLPIASVCPRMRGRAT